MLSSINKKKIINLGQNTTNIDQDNMFGVRERYIPIGMIAEIEAEHLNEEKEHNGRNFQFPNVWRIK